MSKKRDFLKQFFKQKKKIGAVSPSSRFLASKMLENIDFNNCKVIVELGPGTGVFTRKIIQNMADDAKLFVFELHEPFYLQLKKEFQNDKRVEIILDSAENIGEHLKSHSINQADVVLSSLPLANFNKDLVKSILNSIYDYLSMNGMFIQFQYSLRSKKQVDEIFDDTKLSFTPRNLPPAFVYTCIKK